MSGLALLGFLVLYLSPIGGLFAQTDRRILSDVIASPGFLKSLQVTIVVGGVAALISVILGIFFGRHFALYQWKGKRLQKLALLLPYLIPNFILATAYVIAWNPSTGLLNSWLPLPFSVYGTLGMICLFSIVHAPVALLLVEDKLRRMDASWREAAQLSGAGRFAVLGKIELPILLPTLASAFALCFTLNISAFAIPAWLGAPAHVYPLTYKVYQAIEVGGAEGIPQAAAISISLFLIALVPLALVAWVGRNERKFVLLGGKASRSVARTPTFRTQAFFQGLFFAMQILFWLAPLSCLVASTAVKPGCLQQGGFACFRELTLKSYSYVLFDLAETRSAFWQTLLWGTLSAVMIIAIAVFGMGIFSKSRVKLRALDWILSATVATPGAVIALGLIVTWSGRFGVNLYNTPWILVAAYIMKHTNLAFQPIRTGFVGISGSLVEAGKLSGASSRQIWGRILLPILKPELMGAFFLVLIPILGELTMSIFLASPSFRPIGAVMFDLQDYADQASAGALSVLLILLVLLMNQFARTVSRGRLGY